MTEQLLTRAEVQERTSVSRATLYRMMAAGEFPRSVRIGSQAVRWRKSEIAAWIEALPRLTGDTAGACFQCGNSCG